MGPHAMDLRLTAATRLDGVGGSLAIVGPTDAAPSEAYVGCCLVPALRPGDIVVMENPGLARDRRPGD